MNLKRLIKFFSIALVFQLFVLLTFPFLINPLVSGLLPAGSEGRHFLLLYVYYPFIKAVISAGGYRGESSMIWPPLFGTLLGVLTYSIIFALLASSLKRNRERRTKNTNQFLKERT
jgi:hypothetical protein